MADYSDFSSMGTTYDFSKGPKSLYYAKGDEDLFGLVLNVPQQDDDDEWGGTERIALERTADAIGSLQEIVSDPAGSTNGLVQKVAALESIVHVADPLSNSYVEVGNVVVSGDTESITIGTDALLDAETLQLGGATAFRIDEVSANRYDILYKTNDAIRFFDDLTNPTVTIIVGASSYIFSPTSLAVPGLSMSGDLTVSGDIYGTNLSISGDAEITGDILPGAPIGNIGAPAVDARWENVYAKNGSFSGTFAINGVTTLNDILNVTGDVNVTGDIEVTGDVLPVDAVRNLGAPAVDARWQYVYALNGNFSGTFAINGVTTISDILNVTGDVNVTGDIEVTGDVLPVDAVRNLGAPAVDARWQYVYALNGSFSGNLAVLGDIYSVAFVSYTSTITGWTVATNTLYYKKIGKTVIVHVYITGTSNNAAANFTLPVAMNTSVTPLYFAQAVAVEDSTTPQASPGCIVLVPATSSTVAYCGKDMTGPGNFTASGSKSITGTLIYEAA